MAAYVFFDVVSVHPERMSGYRDEASMNRITVAFLVVLAALTAGAGTVSWPRSMPRRRSIDTFGSSTTFLRPRRAR
jgi:hypothetical protein